MKLKYPAYFYPWDNGKGYTVEIPDLPGCISEGDDLEEALYMISDAAYWWVIDEIKEGRLPPNERETKEDTLDNGGFIKIIEIEID